MTDEAVDTLGGAWCSRQEFMDRILAEPEDFILEGCDINEYKDYIEMITP